MSYRDRELTAETEVIKSVIVSQEEMRRLKRTSMVTSSMEDHVAKVVAAMYDEVEERREVFWNEVAKKLGYDDYLDACMKGVMLRFAWDACTIEARKKIEAKA